jgi:hypothetical protein
MNQKQLIWGFLQFMKQKKNSRRIIDYVESPFNIVNGRINGGYKISI